MKKQMEKGIMRRIVFDRSDAAADRFAALYNVFILAIVLDVQAGARGRTLSDVRTEAAIQDKLDGISVPSLHGGSTPEPMRELSPERDSDIVLSLTPEEHKAMSAAMERAVVRVSPSLQRKTLDAMAFFDSAEKVDPKAAQERTQT